MVRQTSCLIFILSIGVCSFADTEQAVNPLFLPYDETADARKDINKALVAAQKHNKLVLITFGANWCPDCRAFERAMNELSIAKVVDTHFIPVKVDVGDWDKNLQLIASWGKATTGGIPTVVVATPGSEILYTTRAGELSKARNMGSGEFAKFFDYLAGFKLQH